jgi:peptidoglycan/LPS O-acetylase OafA/YrhL
MADANRFDTLDAIRGLAALFVVFRHTPAFGPGPADTHSYLAVDLFFVLSGFVVAHAYDRRLLDGTIGFARFAALRLIRLYPIVLLSIPIAAAVALTVSPLDAPFSAPHAPFEPTHGQVLLGSLLSLVFLPAVLGTSLLLFPLNSALWSLSFEIAVNLIYAALRPRLGERTLAALVAIGAAALAAVALRGDGLDSGWAWGPSSILKGLLRAGVGFGLGLLLQRVLERRPLRSLQVPPVLVVALAIAPLMVPTLPYGNGWTDLIAVLVVFPLAVALGTASRPTGRLSTIAIVLGAASYPVYALHIPLLRLLERTLAALGMGPGPLDLPRLAIAALFTVALVALALVVERCIDRPLRRALTARLGRPRAPAPAPVGTAA